MTDMDLETDEGLAAAIGAVDPSVLQQRMIWLATHYANADFIGGSHHDNYVAFLAEALDDSNWINGGGEFDLSLFGSD